MWFTVSKEARAWLVALNREQRQSLLRSKLHISFSLQGIHLIHHSFHFYTFTHLIFLLCVSLWMCCGVYLFIGGSGTTRSGVCARRRWSPLVKGCAFHSFAHCSVIDSNQNMENKFLLMLSKTYTHIHTCACAGELCSQQNSLFVTKGMEFEKNRLSESS